MKSNNNWKRLSLKESLFLGFCAVFILIFRASFRLNLNIPGHAMLFTVFFLMLARACVPYRLSATWTGMIAGAMAMVLGMGKGGPLIVSKFLLPAIVIDIGAALMPQWHQRYLLSLVMAACAAATRFLSIYLVDVLIGMDRVVTLQHALIKSSSGILFGMAGSLFIPPVVKKLQAFGVVERHFPQTITETDNS